MRTAKLISTLLLLVLTFAGACAAPQTTAVVPPPAVPLGPQISFKTGELSLDPQMVLLAQTTRIDVVVTSTDDKTGNCTVFLNVDGVDVKSQNLTLDSGASRNVTFYYFSTITGNHTIRVGDSTAFLMVHVVDVTGEMNHAGMPGM